MTNEPIHELGHEPVHELVYKTRCCACGNTFTIRPSLSMLHGINTGHVSCPACKTFLHVELLEGDQAWSELWANYVEREKRGPGLIEQSTTGL